MTAIHRFLPALLLTASLGLAQSQANQADLPSPAEFDPAKYLGKWFEVARLPAPAQPEGTLATAEYSKGEKDGMVVVKNTAYDAKGEVMVAMEGQAQLVEGGAKGRLKVSFGPGLPEKPNYHVLRIDKNYQISVVGSPDRKSLWILSRKVPVPQARLDRLAKVAEKAGYDTSKLIFAKWPEKFSGAGKKARSKESGIAGEWTFHIKGPNGEDVEMPLHLKVDGDQLTGHVGRQDGSKLEIEAGKVEGDAFTGTIERNRPQGGVMKYALEAKLADGKLVGKAKTDIEGNEIVVDWHATRVAAKKSNVAGKWTLHLDNPNGGQVDLPMILNVEGKKLTGRVGRGEGRWMKLKDGKVDGDAFTFTVERDRESGGSMIYAVEGKFADGKLTGTAKTEIEGRGEITTEWDADPQSAGTK